MNPLVLLLLAVGAIALLPAGCATQRIEVPKEVRIEVPVACVKQRPTAPALHTVEELLRMDRGTRTIAAWADLHRAEAYISELEAVVTGCSLLP